MFSDYTMWSVNAKLVANYGSFFGSFGAMTEFNVGQVAEVNTFFNFNLSYDYEKYKINHYFYSKDIKQALIGLILNTIRKEGEALKSKYISSTFEENDFYSKFYKIWLSTDGVKRTLEMDQGVVFKVQLSKKDENNIYEASLGEKGTHVTVYRYNPKGKRVRLISKPYYGTGDLIDYINYCDNLIRIGESWKEA